MGDKIGAENKNIEISVMDEVGTRRPNRISSLFGGKNREILYRVVECGIFGGLAIAGVGKLIDSESVLYFGAGVSAMASVDYALLHMVDLYGKIRGGEDGN